MTPVDPPPADTRARPHGAAIAPADASLEDSRRKATAWGVPFLLGLLIVAMGIFCVAVAGITSLASILVLGSLLVVAGIVEIVQAFRRRKDGNFFLFFLGGLLSAVVGVMMVLQPIAGLVAVTLLLAGYFLASGLFRGITSVMDRYPRWGWDFFYGLVSVVLGIMLFAQLSTASLWLVGTLVGVELLARGISLMGAAMALRKALRSGILPPSPAPPTTTPV